MSVSAKTWILLVLFCNHYSMQAILLQILEAKTLKSFFSCVLVGFSFLVGSIDIALKAMFVAILFDFILGLGYAVYHGQFCKKKFLEWLKKEMIFCVAIILGHLADLIIFHKEVEWWLQNLFISYIGINEVLSSLRHLAKMGWKAPKKIIDRLEGYRDNLSVTK